MADVAQQLVCFVVRRLPPSVYAVLFEHRTEAASIGNQRPKKVMKASLQRFKKSGRFAVVHTELAAPPRQLQEKPLALQLDPQRVLDLASDTGL